MKIIGFIGLPGSGKGAASEVARKMGIPVAVMGDVIREEASRLGLLQTDENLGGVGNSLRAREGKDVVARRTLERARGSGGDLVVIDGIRSKDEVDYFRANSAEFMLIEVWAPADARLKWITSRGRPDDPRLDHPRTMGEPENETADQKTVVSCRDGTKQTAEALERRECRELGWGMSEAIKGADRRIANSGSLEEFQKSVREVLEEFALAEPDQP